MCVYTSMGREGQDIGIGAYSFRKTFRLLRLSLYSLGIKIGVILIVIAIFDYIYQKYEYEKSLKMSKQDIKDEYKSLKAIL